MNGTVPMHFVNKMASGLVPILACETVKLRIAHTVLKCPALPNVSCQLKENAKLTNVVVL